MRAKLEKEMTAAHEEQKRRQRAVERLLAKELVNEKSETRKKGKQTKSENSRSCKPATQLSQTPKVVTPRVSIAPLILALHTKEETPNPSSSTIHEVRKIVSSLSPKDIGVKSAEIKRAPATTRPKPGPGNGTQTRLLRPPPPYPPGPGCKRSLPAVHPYLRPGLGNPQAQPPTSFHMAVLNSNPASSHNQPPNNIIPPSKEHIIERLGAVTRELGKYFPPQKPSVEKAISDTVKIVQPILKPEIETTETETNETEEDDAEPRNTRSLEYEMIQEVAKVAASDVSEVAPAMPIPEGLSEQPSVSIPALPNLAERFPHSETACEELHQAKANESIDGQICEELKKFGITLSTNGISDTTYNSISSALEMQRLLRMSQIYGNDRNILEYERGAVAWHTQRAICDRDKAIIESQVAVTESGFGSEVDGTENRAGETGRSHYSLTTGLVQNHKKNEFDSKSRDELTLARASHRRSNEQCGPQSSESSGSSDSLQETVESNNKNQFVSRAKHLSSSKADGRKYFSPRSRPHEGQPQHASRAFALKPTQKQAKSSRNNRDRPSSRGELVRSSPEFVDNRWQPELDEEEVEEDLGLGDWDSDDDTVPSRGKQR
ncbi:hypothetical protein KC19_8G044700 [Ceratodon purpureus]|uniref:Uncharacterized protein n=1 Tax=Ceratodon purpureus TaxID=3225 RepID=A0A8T0GZR1_CERPU|nr:hypothetical protein KC19_8G044700 [Ceratodon purpureus]